MRNRESASSRVDLGTLAAAIFGTLAVFALLSVFGDHGVRTFAWAAVAVVVWLFVSASIVGTVGSRGMDGPGR
jgi:undecaprenyl pyrophosphate phosphatase UppP